MNRVEVIIEKKIKRSRKDRPCDSSMYVREAIHNISLTFGEKKSFIIAKKNGWKIKKGEPYVDQFNKSEGNLYHFRAIPEMHMICLKYDLYGDD